MSRLAPTLALLLTLSTASLALAAAPASPAGPFDPPGITALHLADAAAQRERLVKLGMSKSWAPDLGPSDIDVLHYTMDLHIDIEREVLSGTVAMEVEAAVDNLSAVEVDADQGLRILGVMLAEDESFGYDGMRVLPFDHQHDRLSMQLPRALSRGERVTLLVSYGGHAGYYGGGVNWRDNGYGARVVYTFAEPFGSRLWWPCNDRPDDKATVDMSVTAPSWMVVSSNGLETGREERADGSATTSWSSRYPVATYLVVMNASNYEVSELDYTRADGSTMPVVTYAYPGIADDAERDLAITPDMITTLAARFGEYPFVEEKYGNCLTPFGGGMEHQTLTTLSQNAIGGNGIDWLNVHELGHQWWGDWISPDDWRELWLNEGFATYSEIVWAEHVGPETLAQVVEDMDWRGYFLGAAYDNPVPFSSTVYEKGSWILRMLRHVLGDETFFAAILEYLETFGGATATTEALQAIFERHSVSDLDWFFQQWVYGENRPRYQYSWSEVAGPMVRLVVTQEHSNAPLFRMPMDVQITTTDGTELTTVWLEAEAEQSFDIAVGHTPTEVVLDPDHQVLCELSPAGEPDLDLGPGYPGPFPGGTLLGGTSSTITIPLNNVGGSDLVIDSDDGPAIYPWNGRSYELVAPTEFPLTIAPGESEELQIRFTPAGVGSIGDRFVIESNDPSRDGVTILEVGGTGVNSLDPFFSVPPIFMFGNVPVGGSAELVFDIANEGAEDLTLSATMTVDDFVVATSLPEVLTPGQVVPMTVRFAPTEVGNRIGNLVFTSNDPLRPERTVLLRGVGTEAPRIAVDPPSVLFGLTEQPTPTTVTVSNVGLSDLEVSELTIDAPFELADAPGLPMSLPPGESMTVDIQLGTADAGTFRGALRFLSNDPSLPWATVLLEGQVVESDVLYWAYPAVASAEGLGGASWSTNTYFLNPTDVELALDLRFMSPGKRLAGPPDATVTIPAHNQRTLADVVASIGHEGTGGLDVGGECEWPGSNLPHLCSGRERHLWSVHRRRGRGRHLDRRLEPRPPRPARQRRFPHQLRSAQPG